MLHTRKFCIIVGLTILGVLLLGACQPNSSRPLSQPVVVQTLRIKAPTQIAAGASLTVTIYATPKTANHQILLTTQGTFGFYPYQATVVDGATQIIIAPAQTRHAGTVQLRARSNQIEAVAEVEIVPDVAVDPVLPLVGPRSIVADGKHWTMVVTTPRDRWRNPVAEHSLLTLRAQHPVSSAEDPSSGLEVIETTTQNLLAWARIYSHTRAGRTLISATAGNAHSPERSVMEVPGMPTPFVLQADRLIVPADGRQWVRLQSDQITDAFGNVLLDGTHITVLATMDQAEWRTLPAFTIDGRIDTMLQAPSEPGTMVVRGSVSGVHSAPLSLTFTAGPAVWAIPITTFERADGIVVRAGPLLGTLGQFIPDGTDVTFVIKRPNGYEEQWVAPADYGYAEIVVRNPTLLSGLYQATVSAGMGQGMTDFVIAERQ